MAVTIVCPIPTEGRRRSRDVNPLTSNHESITSLIPNCFDFADGDSEPALATAVPTFDGGNSLNSDPRRRSSIRRQYFPFDAAFGTGSYGQVPRALARPREGYDIDAFSISGRADWAPSSGAIFPFSQWNAFTFISSGHLAQGIPLSITFS
jgi:hypothetical protein